MTTTTDTEAALLAAVFEHPDDDTPRVVYADYLDEQAGELPGRDPAEMRARAEFIRVQCELERMPELDRHQVREMALREVRAGMSRHERNQPESILLDKAIRIERRISEERTELRRRFCNRERALLKQWEETWRRAGECPECLGTGREENPVEDCPHCAACGGTGDTGGLLRCDEPIGAVGLSDGNGTYYPAASWTHPVRFRRGWLDAVEVPRLEDVLEERCVRCTATRSEAGERGGGCAACEGGFGASIKWQPTAWARALRAHRSLTRVVAGDVNECLDGYGTCWWWRDDVIHDHDPRLPATIAPKGTYLTREAAVDALAVAVCEVVRGHG